MSSHAMINEFMAQKNLALIRASRTKPVSGFHIDFELGKKGYSVTVVYLDEEESGSKLRGLRDSSGGVIIAVPPDHAEKAVRLAIESNIPRIWIQRDCESKSAIQLCESRKIPLITGECVLMFAEPVKSFHAFHRWLWKVFGKLPK